MNRVEFNWLNELSEDLPRSSDTVVDTEEFRKFFEDTVDPLVTYKDDPLVLSCASYRLWTERSWTRWTRLEELDGNVIEGDRLMAQSIRDYYIGRLTFEKLCGSNFTKYRQNLADFLINNKPLKHSELGLVYSLPYFYVEDIEKDEIFESVRSLDVIDNDDYPFPRHFSFNDIELYPVKEIFSYRKGGDICTFWFKSQSNEPYTIEVRKDNSLIKFVRSIFKQEKVKINGQGKVRSLKYNGQRYYYCKMFDTELAQ